MSLVPGRVYLKTNVEPLHTLIRCSQSRGLGFFPEVQVTARINFGGSGLHHSPGSGYSCRFPALAFTASDDGLPSKALESRNCRRMLGFQTRALASELHS